MKRHTSLRDLSSDHHAALVQAHRLKGAATADITTRRIIVAEFFHFWREHGHRHFCEEEQALLPFFARWGELNQEPIHQMLREHALIRRDVARLQEGETRELICGMLGKQLRHMCGSKSEWFFRRLRPRYPKRPSLICTKHWTPGASSIRPATPGSDRRG